MDFDIKNILSKYKADMKRLRRLQYKLLDVAEVDKISSTAATWDSLSSGQRVGDSKADRYLIIKEELETEIQTIKERNKRLEMAINELGLYYSHEAQLLVNCLYRDGMSTEKTKERMSIYNPSLMRTFKSQALERLQVIYNSKFLGM